MLKKTLFISCVLGIILLSVSYISFAQQKPNIVVFLVDDMGWMDTSVPFGDKVMELNRRYHTPNMERLVKQGMKFTNAYAAPVCTPSRVSLMSGMNAAHHMVTNWTSLEKDTPSDFDSKENPLKTPAWNINGMSPNGGIPGTVQVTPLPQLLQDAGYYTIHIGKSHLATWGTPAASPYNIGFLVNIAGNIAGQPQSYLGEENFGNQPNKTTYYAVQNLTEYYGTKTFLTEALTLEAKKALEHPIKTKQPFFLYLAHYAVHLPLDADARFYEPYIKAGLDSNSAKYASMVEGVDKSLGDVMDYLEAKKVSQNTVIIFMSDNGGNSVSPVRGGPLHTQNLPLREGKGSVYEGGIREPMIVKWPGVVKPGTKDNQPLIIEDFFPSILEIAGVKKPTLIQKVDGKSFVPRLKGIKVNDPDRIFTWHYPNKWKAKELEQIDYMSAIRQGNWKLVYDMKTQRLELYNLKDDIGELHDLSATNKDKVKKLAKLLTDRFKSYGTLMPHYKKTGKQVAWPDEVAQL
jgi:arylsulfatase A-like enzyme